MSNSKIQTDRYTSPILGNCIGYTLRIEQSYIEVKSRSLLPFLKEYLISDIIDLIESYEVIPKTLSHPEFNSERNLYVISQRLWNDRVCGWVEDLRNTYDIISNCGNIPEITRKCLIQTKIPESDRLFRVDYFNCNVICDTYSDLFDYVEKIDINRYWYSFSCHPSVIFIGLRIEIAESHRGLVGVKGANGPTGSPSSIKEPKSTPKPKNPKSKRSKRSFFKGNRRK